MYCINVCSLFLRKTWEKFDMKVLQKSNISKFGFTDKFYICFHIFEESDFFV